MRTLRLPGSLAGSCFSENYPVDDSKDRTARFWEMFKKSRNPFEEWNFTGSMSNQRHLFELRVGSRHPYMDTELLSRYLLSFMDSINWAGHTSLGHSQRDSAEDIVTAVLRNHTLFVADAGPLTCFRLGNAALRG